MVNCSLKLRIDTKNCIKCTHNLIFSCSAICWNVNLDFPFQGGFFPHFQHQQPGQRQWSLSSIPRLWGSSQSSSLPMSYMQGQYHLSRQQAKEKSAKSPCTELLVPTCWGWWARRTPKPALEPWKQTARLISQQPVLHYSCPVFLFLTKFIELKNQSNSWFNCPAQTGTNFSTGVTFVKGQCCKLRSIKSSPNI